MYPSPGPAAYDTLRSTTALSNCYTSISSMSRVGRRWIAETSSPGPKYLPNLTKKSIPQYRFPTADRFPCLEKENTISSLSYRPNPFACSQYTAFGSNGSKLYTTDKFHGIYNTTDGPGPAGYFPNIKYVSKGTRNSYMPSSQATRNSYILNSPFF